MWGVFALFLAAMGTAIWYFTANNNDEEVLLYVGKFFPSKDVPEFRNVEITVNSVSPNNIGIRADESEIKVVLTEEQISELKKKDFGIDMIEVELESAGGEVVLKSEEHSEKRKMLDNIRECIWGYEDENKHSTKFDSLYIKLPAQDEYEEVNDSILVPWNRLNEIFSSSCNYDESIKHIFADLCIKKMRNDHDPISIHKYQDIFGDIYQDSIRAWEQENETFVENFVSQYREELWNDKCSMETVGKVKKAWKEFPDAYKGECKLKYDFKIAIEKYESFFDPKKTKKGSKKGIIDELYKNDNKYFSKAQIEVLGYYAYNSKTFECIRDSKGITFDISEEEFKILKKDEK